MMAQDNTVTGVNEIPSAHPTVREISTADLFDALIKGLADFNAMPTHLPFLALIYPVVTFFTIEYFGNYNALPFIFPLVAGYTLVGPLVAIGMYELSRRRETQEKVSRWHLFDVIHSPQIISIIGLTTILMFIYFVWMSAAWAIYSEFTGGAAPESIAAFAEFLVTTKHGLQLIYVGCSVGMIFSIIVLAVSLTSFPMLLDRKVSLITAIHTSVDVVYTNPVTIAIWGIIVLVGLALGSLPAFVGLAVVLPVLGHATWHLYRKVVVY